MPARELNDRNDRAEAMASRHLGGGRRPATSLLGGLVARTALAGNTTRPGAEHLAVARREGWLHVPTVDLESINGPSQTG